MNNKEDVLAVLRQLGFIPKLIDDDFGYGFEYEGLTILYLPNKDDNSCLTFMMPNIFDITEDNRVMALEAMAVLSSSVKYVQPFLMGKDQVWLNYQHYLGEGENEVKVTEDLVEHIIRVLAVSTAKFHQIINTEEDDN